MTSSPDASTQDFLSRAQRLAEEAAALAADAGHVVADAANTHADYFFMSGLSVFVLACFVGYYVVWRVTPALHTPLMSVTNAISGIIIVGAMIALGPVEGSGFSRVLGFFAVFLASVNIFGGFLVTQRMLEMYRKKENKKE